MTDAYIVAAARTLLLRRGGISSILRCLVIGGLLIRGSLIGRSLIGGGLVSRGLVVCSLLIGGGLIGGGLIGSSLVVGGFLILRRRVRLLVVSAAP